MYSAFSMYSAAATACEYSIREEEGKDKWNQTKELREEVGEIVKKKWKKLKKRVAALEVQVKKQQLPTPESTAHHLKEILLEQLLRQPFENPKEFWQGR